MPNNTRNIAKQMASRIEGIVQRSSLEDTNASKRAPVTIYWEIGNSIVRSPISKKDKRTLDEILTWISESLRRKLGERFHKENLKVMVNVASTFTDKQKLNTLASRLNWSQFRLLSELADRTEAQALAIRCYNQRLNTPQLEQILPKSEKKTKPRSKVIKPVAKKAASHGRSEPPKSAGTKSGKSSGTIFKVWYATNRKPKANGSGFTQNRSDNTTLGRVLVRIPESHRFGEIGTPFLKRLLQLKWRDDHLQVQDILNMEHSEFFEELKEAALLASEGVGEPHALCFIHGFNVDFDEAAIRAAQIGFDLKVPGPTAFFSWPSRGGVASYSADEASIEASAGPITDFLVEFANHCGAKKIHLIAHSMGNRGLLSALQRIAFDAEARARIKFGQIFLAAPDVDRDVFIDLAKHCPSLCDRTTLYSSNRDLAIWLSKTKHKAPRAGYHPPYTVAQGVDTICVPNFNLDLLGHSYYAEAEALLHDMFDLMRQGLAPGLRQRILETSDGSSKFWKFIP